MFFLLGFVLKKRFSSVKKRFYPAKTAFSNTLRGNLGKEQLFGQKALFKRKSGNSCFFAKRRNFAYPECLAYILARETAFGSVSWFARLFSQSRGRFDFPLVRSGLKIAIFKYNIVCGACSCSPGWKIAIFKYRCSMRSVRLENRNF